MIDHNSGSASFNPGIPIHCEIIFGHDFGHEKFELTFRAFGREYFYCESDNLKDGDYIMMYEGEEK